jgi:hypothetical protein
MLEDFWLVEDRLSKTKRIIGAGNFGGCLGVIGETNHVRGTPLGRYSGVRHL